MNKQSTIPYKMRYDIEPMIANAALSGEQRMPLHLKHCAVNTKADSNENRRALGIRLKRLVICHFPI